MNEPYFYEKTLVVNGKELSFDYELDSILNVNEVTIALVDIPSNNKDVDNVYGIINGEINWRIQNASDVYPHFSQTPYVGISITGDEDLLVTDFCGCRFIINPRNGKIIERANSTK